MKMKVNKGYGCVHMRSIDNSCKRDTRADKHKTDGHGNETER